MVEDELRAAFVRHENLAPDPGPLRAAIARTTIRRRRRRLAVRAGGTVLAVLAAVSVPLLGRDLIGQVPARSGSAPGSSQPAASVPGTALNFLLLGVDGGAGSGSGVRHRADTVLIAHIPRDRSRMYLISLPWELSVEVPGQVRKNLDATFQASASGSGHEALTTGAGATRDAVTRLTGIRFDGTAVLTYTGLGQLTDAAGGLRVCLPERLRSAETGRVFPAGCQQLDGRASLDLLRQQHGRPDRTRPQAARERERSSQRLAHALLNRMVTAPAGPDPTQLMKMAAAAGGSLAIDTGGIPPLDLLEELGQTVRAEPVGVSLELAYAGYPGPTQDFKWVDPAVADALFTAVRQDTLSAWADTHPDQLTSWSAQR